MEETDNLRLPYLMAAQAQKHVTHNEALRALDAIVQIAIEDRDLAAPPPSPSNGARYLVAGSASGNWSGHDGEFAAYQDGAWSFHQPREGWIAWVSDEHAAFVYDGTGWIALASGNVNPASFVGVNATADSTNRLAVSSPASLFNHEGSGHQQKINKAAAGDTASVLFQTDFSGRAEMGLTGDDDYHFKVSPNGSTWNEAITIDKDTGEVSFPNTSLAGGVNQNLLVNGDFQINQRGFAGGALSAGDYGFDRWKAATGGANVSVSGYTVTLTSGEIEQVVELALWGQSSFASQQVTISVEAPSADMTATFGSKSGTIPAGSGRQSVTLTLGAGDTGNLIFKLKKASGSGVAFRRVKLEVAASATAWLARPANAEHLLAYRYYLMIKPALYGVFFIYAHFSNDDLRAIFYYPTPMRSAPSVTYSDAGDFQVLPTETIASLTTAGVSDVSFTPRIVTSSGTTAGDAYILRSLNGNATIELDAEF